MVLYAFLQDQEEQETEVIEEKKLRQHAEADTFLVFEAVMLFLKPFYEIVKTRPEAPTVLRRGMAVDCLITSP